MATKKSTHSEQQSGMVEVPHLKETYRKAPPVDPYLTPGTVTSKTLTFGDITLPPILSGVEPGKDLSGKPVDRKVSVIWISRRQIDWALRAVEQKHPELEPILQIVSKYMGHLDTVRSEAGFGIGCAKSWINSDKPESKAAALETLDSVNAMLGGWHDEARLYVRC